MPYERRVGETQQDFIRRVCDDKDLIGTWNEVADILNAVLGLDHDESCYRRMYKRGAAQEGRYERNEASTAAARPRPNSDNKEPGNELYELVKERRKLRDEKNEYQRWLRAEARDEAIVEKIIEAVHDLPPIEVPGYSAQEEKTDGEYVLMLGDEHYGAEFTIKGLRGEIINQYSPEIFEERMWKLLDRVSEIVEWEEISRLKVFLLGDELDGVLRPGQLMKLRCGVVDATVRYMEFMAVWLNELTKLVGVELHMTDGNHSELRFFNQKSGAFENENMGKIIRAYWKARLADNARFKLVENESGLIYTSTAGYNLLGVHGEMKNLEDGIKQLENTYRQNIDYLVCGHLHHAAYETTGMFKGVLRVPSVMGTDSFAMKLRRSSQPAATLVKFEEGRGKTVEWSISLNEGRWNQ